MRMRRRRRSGADAIACEKNEKCYNLVCSIFANGSTHFPLRNECWKQLFKNESLRENVEFTRVETKTTRKANLTYVAEEILSAFLHPVAPVRTEFDFPSLFFAFLFLCSYQFVWLLMQTRTPYAHLSVNASESPCSRARSRSLASSSGALRK